MTTQVTTTPATAEHRIRWFARSPGTPDDWTPRTASMRGSWPWDVRCSCGQETRTGGATERHIRERVAFHRDFGQAL